MGTLIGNLVRNTCASVFSGADHPDWDPSACEGLAERVDAVWSAVSTVGSYAFRIAWNTPAFIADTYNDIGTIPFGIGRTVQVVLFLGTSKIAYDVLAGPLITIMRPKSEVTREGLNESRQ